MNEQAITTLRALAQQRQSARGGPLIVQEIAEATGIAFSVAVDEIFGKDKHKSIAEARGVACYVARKCTRMSFTEIGRAMGLDQSTVRSAVRRVEGRRVTDRWTDSVCAVLLGQFGVVGESAKQ